MEHSEYQHQTHSDIKRIFSRWKVCVHRTIEATYISRILSKSCKVYPFINLSLPQYLPSANFAAFASYFSYLVVRWCLNHSDDDKMSYYLCYTYLKNFSACISWERACGRRHNISLWICVRSVRILFDNEIMVGVGAPCQDNVVSWE